MRSTRFMAMSYGGLLDDEIVFDVRYALDGGRILAGSEFLVGRVHKAAQLHDALDRLDTDRERFHRLVAEQSALHFGRDDRIVDVLTGAFARGRRRAAGGQAAEGEGAGQGEK